MMKINVVDLKIGDDVLFQRKKLKDTRWLGKVKSINKRGEVRIRHSSLFYYGENKSQTQFGYFDEGWNNDSDWSLYKLTEKEVLGFTKELIILNLK